MLRQVFIIKEDDIIFQKVFGNALSREEVKDLRFKVKREAKREHEKSVGFFDYYKYRVAYRVELDLDLIFIFITGLMDDFFRLIQPIMNSFKDEFLKRFDNDSEEKQLDSVTQEDLSSIMDSLHSEIKPKISVVGFSGVGKTTIKNLIKKDEISLQHIPTISGDIATIKIDKLQFSLFDFAGQEQYKYLWKGFIKGSNAVLVVTDSTPINVEKSRFFIDLRNNEAPYAHIAVIGNKQDLKNAMKAENIENILGLKTYPMIANKPENRDKMISIINDILDLNIDTAPLIEDINLQEEELEQEDIIEHEKETLEKIEEIIETEKIDKNFRGVSLDLDLCNELIRDIKGVHIENILRNHFKMISSTIKKLNNNEELSYEDFNKYYQDYIENSFKCSNVALNQFLESQFSLIKKSFDEDEFISTKLKDDLNIIINALMCAYFTMANQFKYPIFETILKEFKLDKFDAQTVKEIQSYYLRILNKFII